eukprot:356690-Chlamydomonas_euryale.AAC.10
MAYYDNLGGHSWSAKRYQQCRSSTPHVQQALAASVERCTCGALLTTWTLSGRGHCCSTLTQHFARLVRKRPRGRAVCRARPQGEPRQTSCHVPP